MAMTKRGVAITIILVVALVGAAVGIFVFVRQQAVPTFVAPTIQPPPPPPTPTVPPPTTVAPPPPLAPPPTNFFAPQNDQIVRCTGSEPTELSINCSQLTFPNPNTAEAAYLSRKDNPVDAFVGSSLIGATNGTYIAVDTNQVSPAVLAELGRVLVNKAAPIRILGGVVAVSDNVINQLLAAGYTDVARIFGPNRNATAAKIAEEIIRVNAAAGGNQIRSFVLSENQFLVDAYGVGPSLSGKAPNTRLGYILLADRGSSVLPQVTVDFLDQHPELVVADLVGGDKAINPQVESYLRTRMAIVTRTADVDRYWTNYRWLQRKYSQDPVGAVLGNGDPNKAPGGNELYSLQAGSAMASMTGFPLLLMMPDNMPEGQCIFLHTYNLAITGAGLSGNFSDITPAGEAEVQALISGRHPVCP